MRMRPLFLCALMLAMNSARAQDPAREKLLSVLNRFGNQSVFSLVDVVTEERFGGNDSYRVEVWKKGTAGKQTLAIFVLAPKSDQGVAFLIQESATSADGRPIRHMYLPALDKVTQVRGLRRSRIDKRLSGLVGPTLLEIGPDTKAITLGVESEKNKSLRKIRAENREGETFEIWLEESATPIIYRAVRLDKKGKTEQILNVERFQSIGGRRIEAAGTIIVPKKSETRFEIIDGRILNGADPGPFTLETFAARARQLANTEASSE